MEDSVMGNDNGGGSSPWPWLVKIMPILMEELLGRKVRIVYPGNVITQEYEPGRVTIYVTEEHRIDDIKIEPDEPEKKLMGNGNGGGDFPWPWSVKNMPILVKELLGRKVRIVYPGDKINPKVQPGRVTIYVTEEHRIDDIKIEPDEPTE